MINLEHRNVNAFSERDRTFLETLAVQAIIAWHTVELYGRLQKQVQQALSLGTIAAQFLEQRLVLNSGLLGMLAVGFCEEIAKPLGVLWLARRHEFMSARHGFFQERPEETNRILMDWLTRHSGQGED